MPDTGKRISELGGATADTGTELLPEVQGGVTVNDTVNDIRGVDDAINDGVVNRPPSQNAVHDALVLKEDTAAVEANHLRVDTAAQGLSSTQKANAETNLGLRTVTALAALNHDCLADGEHTTKAIAANSTFTVSNVPASGNAYGFSMALTITSAAVPTWFSGVKWAGGAAPTLGNGLHLLFFFTSDGGTTWLATYGKAFA